MGGALGWTAQVLYYQSGDFGRRASLQELKFEMIRLQTKINKSASNKVNFSFRKKSSAIETIIIFEMEVNSILEIDYN